MGTELILVAANIAHGAIFTSRLFSAEAEGFSFFVVVVEMVLSIQAKLN